MQKTQIVRARWEVKGADLWVGIFVRLGYPDLDLDIMQKVVHIWICFVPCVPLHLQILPSRMWLASYWTLKLRCDSETWMNAWERWFYTLKALWCLWMRPTQRRDAGDDEIVAAVWNVFANGEGHAWDEVRVGTDVFRNWWAAAGHESE
jgi:hypothetical protein